MKPHTSTHIPHPTLGGDLRGLVFGLLLSLLPTIPLAAQDSLVYRVETAAIASAGGRAPLWLHANRYGLYSQGPFSWTTRAEAGKELSRDGRWLDYAFKLSGVLRVGNEGAKPYLHEYYARARAWGFLDIAVGAREEHLGALDPVLSSGGLLFSRNARPMPKIVAGIEDYTGIPFTQGFVQVRGALVHGWFNDPRYVQGAMLHHKYAYVKLGGRWPVNIQYGFEHAAQWGGTSPVYGRQASGLRDWWRIFLGKSGTDASNDNEYRNAAGNHLLSQTLRLDVRVAGVTLSGYWQNLTEDPPIKFIGKTMNAADGLWGVSLRSERWPVLRGIVYEYVNTTDQSGPYHDKDGIIYGGADNYYMNSIFRTGWSYFGRTIGTPFITPTVHTGGGDWRMVNNRVQVHHVAAEGRIAGCDWRTMVSVSRAYGTYREPLASPQTCTSALLEVSRVMPRWWGLEIGCSIGADFGQMPVVDGARYFTGGNAAGVCLSVRKTGTIAKWGR